ncbi:MAG: hypothetical protein GY718_10110 [Lentisphaerae bacterium]|nr:hypothetical protein [Lentisphaerota bacterium]
MEKTNIKNMEQLISEYRNVRQARNQASHSNNLVQVAAHNIELTKLQTEISIVQAENGISDHDVRKMSLA